MIPIGNSNNNKQEIYIIITTKCPKIFQYFCTKKNINFFYRTEIFSLLENWKSAFTNNGKYLNKLDKVIMNIF